MDIKTYSMDNINNIRKMILDKSGLYFKKNDLDTLKDIIAERMMIINCPNPLEYYNLLKEQQDNNREFTELCNSLTNNHTHFFRNPDQLIELRDKVIPEIMDKKSARGDNTLNILSAGCSTGEEPYSIAMILLDLLEKSGQWRFKVQAADISTDALVKAKNGIYSNRNNSRIRNDLIERYMKNFCRFDKNNFYVNPEVKKVVDFQYVNLADEFILKGFDIIFCRNVTIYFNVETVKSIIEKFYGSLNEEGYLFIGATESLYEISDKFEIIEFSNALVHKKISSPHVKSAIQNKKLLELPRIEEETVGSSESKEIAQRLYQEAKRHFAGKDYEKTKQSASKASEIDSSLEEPHVLLAKIFINNENYDAAEQECSKITKINYFSATAHYLLGLIYRCRGEYYSAIEELKRAMYLKPDYSLAQFAAADLLRESGRIKEAVKAFRDTIRALDHESEEEFKEESEGISMSVLRNVCVINIEKLSKAGIEV